MRVEEEGDPRREGIDRQAPCDCRLDVRDSVGEGEGHLLYSGRARLADVVAGDRDRVPTGHLAPAELEDVGRDLERRSRREYVGAPGRILLQQVVLDGAGQVAPRDPVLARNREEKSEQDGSGRVDGHGDRHPVERKTLGEQSHVLDRRDGDPRLSDLAASQRVVGVVTHLGRQIEGHREAGLSLLEQVSVAAVRLPGGAISRVLAHGPVARPVHLRADTAGKGELPRGRLPVERPDGNAGARRGGGLGRSSLLRLPSTGGRRGVLFLHASIVAHPSFPRSLPGRSTIAA